MRGADTPPGRDWAQGSVKRRNGLWAMAGLGVQVAVDARVRSKAVAEAGLRLGPGLTLRLWLELHTLINWETFPSGKRRPKETSGICEQWGRHSTLTYSVCGGGG